MFKINDYVVYQYWVCKVLDIKQLDYSDMGFKKDVTYYILGSVYEKETFDIPITNIEHIRKPLSKEEALNDVEYKQTIHNYNCNSYLKIVKSIYQKNLKNISINKKISNIDDRYFHTAERYLNEELAFALDIPIKDVHKYIENRLEQSNI